MRNVPKLLLILLLGSGFVIVANGTSTVLHWLQEQVISVAVAQDVPEPPPVAPTPPVAPVPSPSAAGDEDHSAAAGQSDSAADDAASRAAARRHARSAAAASSASAAAAEAAQAESDSSSSAASDEWDDTREHHKGRHHRHSDSNNRVSLGDVDVPAGEPADTVAAVFGSANAASPVSDSVVAVFGNATATSTVGDSVIAVFGDARATGTVEDSVVAVLGDVYVNSRVQNVVAVLGNVELGPNAQVESDLTVIGGSLTRAATAVVHGDITRVMDGLAVNMSWTRPWVHNALLYGRPLAFAPGLDWLWGLALGFLVLYALLGLLFPVGLERCVQAFEHHAGESVLTAVAGLLLMPLVAALLIFTLIGIPAIPFLLLGIVAMTMFGKAAIFAWMGRRLTAFAGDGHSAGHTLFAILLGGVVALALYCVPVVGFIVFNLIGLLGFGVALYALLALGRARRQATHPPFAGVPPPFRTPPQGPPFPPPGAAAASAAAAGAGVGTASADGPTGSTQGPAQGPAAPGMGSASAPRYPSFTPIQLLGMPRADFWPRMLSLLIDVVLVSIVLSMTFLNRPHDVQFVALAAYGAVMWKVKGATIGAIVCNHKVVRLDGRELDWPTVIVRALGCLLSLLPIGLGWIWIAIDENRQAWHDKIAGTVVVRVPPGASQFL